MAAEEGKARQGVSRRKVVGVYVALMLLAVPVWWRTTEIYRAPLPFHLLQKPDAEGVPSVQLRLVFSRAIARTVPLPDLRLISEWVATSLSGMHEEQHGVMVSLLKPAIVDSLPSSVSSEAELDRLLHAWLQGAGSAHEGSAKKARDTYNIFVLSTEDAGDMEGSAARGAESRLVMGVHKHGWLICNSASSADSKSLKARLSALPRAVLAAVVGHTPPTGVAAVGQDSPITDAAAASQLQAFLPQKLRVSLSMLVEGVPRAPASWEVEEAIERYLGGFVAALRPMYDIQLDTQVLHFATLAVPPTYSEELQSHTLASSTLNDFINSKDWVLDSTSATVKTLHLLLFVPSPSHSPLSLLDTHNNPLSPPSLLISNWGGVSILNTPHPKEGGLSVSLEELQAPMEHYVGLLRQLLGVDTPQQALWVKALTEPHRGVSEWQLLALERNLALARMASSRKTLVSLEGLVTSIPNMIIHDETASQVSIAISHLLSAERAWAGGNFSQASSEAAMADNMAECSFFHPTMLSMLYFPDDHKLAIYIPYFVPVLLPVLVALLREGKAAIQESKEERVRAEAKKDD